MKKIICGKYNCEFNTNGKCHKKEIAISEDLKCISYHKFVSYEKSEEFKKAEEELYGNNIC